MPGGAEGSYGPSSNSTELLGGGEEDPGPYFHLWPEKRGKEHLPVTVMREFKEAHLKDNFSEPR